MMSSKSSGKYRGAVFSQTQLWFATSVLSDCHCFVTFLQGDVRLCMLRQSGSNVIEQEAEEKCEETALGVNSLFSVWGPTWCED